MTDYLASRTPAERRAIAIVALLIRMHGGKDGEGLFTGVGRYSVLTERLKDAAETSTSVSQFFDRASASLLWAIGPQRYDDAILRLIDPRDDDHDVLRCLAERTASTVMLARTLDRRERAVARGEPVGPAIDPGLNDPLDIFDAVTSAPEPAPAAPADDAEPALL